MSTKNRGIYEQGRHLIRLFSWTSSFLDSIQQNLQGLYFELYYNAAAIAIYFCIGDHINRYVSTLKTPLWNPINTQIYKSDSKGFFDFWIFAVKLQDLWSEDAQVHSQGILFKKSNS